MRLQTEDGEASQINDKMYQFLNNFCKATKVALMRLELSGGSHGTQQSSGD